jgi:hypothetical protein
MGQSEFCRSRGLSWETLNRHLKRRPRKRQMAGPASQLVSVELEDSKTTGQKDFAGLGVVLANGRRIEVGRGFDAHTLEQLVKVLERV